MEPVEINAGAYYLRQLRADDRIDDRKALVDGYADPELRRWLIGNAILDFDGATRFVAERTQQWHTEQRFSWAIAEPTTGELIGEVGLKVIDPIGRTAEVGCWTRYDLRGKGLMTTSLGAALRFGFGGLELHRIEYRHAAGNVSSERVARKCGFSLDGRLREAMVVDGARHDLLLWSRLATD
ncbi:N-acetyltransferase [Pseudonocardiaceae bacterium YIM PH 21723]|nr:N-acetyltransferase [Pseudonocardiaceae bacterium YIM PH 21723]